MKCLLLLLLCFGTLARSIAQGISNNNSDIPGLIGLTSNNCTDIWISSSPPAGVNDNRLRVGSSSGEFHTLLRIDFSKFPKGMTGVRLVLTPFANGLPSIPMALDVVTSPWDNNTSWSNAPSFSFVRQLPAPLPGNAYLIDLTDLHAQWKAGTLPNFGIQLRPLAGSNGVNDFYSSAALPTQIPLLEVSDARRYSILFPLPFTYTMEQLAFLFGSATNDFCGESRLRRTGVGLPAPVGTDVRAAEAGVVKLALKHAKGGIVVIEHQGGPFGPFTTTYENIDPRRKKDPDDHDARSLRDGKLEAGESVQKGDIIGTVMQNPDLAVPQLHFRIREAAYAEPITLLGALPQQDCGGAPAFPEFFYDPARVLKWVQ